MKIFLVKRYVVKGACVASNQGMMLSKGEPCSLVRQPDNEKDVRAIEVYDEDNLRCGYITSADNGRLADLMDRWKQNQLLLEAQFVRHSNRMESLINVNFYISIICPVTEENIQADIKQTTLI